SADRRAGRRSLDDQVRRDDGPPAPSTRGVEKAAGEAERLDDPRLARFQREAEAAIEQIKTDRGEIGHDERPSDRGIERGKHVGAERAADHARYQQPEEQLPVDIAMKRMADARNAGGEALDDVHAGRSRRRRDAQHADQQGAGNDTESHAERAVHELGGKADGDEREQGSQVQVGPIHAISPFAVGAGATAPILNPKDRESFAGRSEAISPNLRLICGESGSTIVRAPGAGPSLRNESRASRPGGSANCGALRRAIQTGRHARASPSARGADKRGDRSRSGTPRRASAWRRTATPAHRSSSAASHGAPWARGRDGAGRGTTARRPARGLV